MTPAIKLLTRSKIDFKVHQYAHDPNHVSFGLEAAEKLAVPAGQVFKTLIAILENKTLVAALVPVNKKLNLKQLARSLNSKKASMAEVSEVQRATGYMPGGVSPLAQKKSLPTIIDNSAWHYDTIFVSAGRRGLEIELTANDLQYLSRAIYADISQLA
ncbi:MAG: Cys-tRNA(Pro) deacylase [Gammaproteobacteria bacterium]|nr:Cys-tRNA(Pro) deacylase [Gammaproteobacteria bacterium]